MWWNTLGCAYRVWQEARSQLQEDQKEIRVLAMSRWRGRGHLIWHKKSQHLQGGLLYHVKTQMAKGMVVDLDMVVYFCPPSTLTYIHTTICGHMETTRRLILR